MSDSLWEIKELEDYQKKLDSELPPYYDFSEVGLVHQEIEATILEYWELLHPVIQDFITSWFSLWSDTKKDIEKLVAEKNQKASMLLIYKDSSDTKIKNLTSQLDTRQSELNIFKQNLEQKEQQIQDLEEKDKEGQLGISELRAELEKQLAELSLKRTEIQNRFDQTNAQVTRAFENKVMIFESEVRSLKEQIENQKLKIKQLQSENEVLKPPIEELEILEDKIGEIIEIVNSISYKEE